MTRRIFRSFSFSVEKKTMLFSPFDFVVLSSPNRVETRRLHLEQKYFSIQIYINEHKKTRINDEGIAGVYRDETMDDKLLYIPNDST